MNDHLRKIVIAVGASVFLTLGAVGASAGGGHGFQDRGHHKQQSHRDDHRGHDYGNRGHHRRHNYGNRGHHSKHNYRNRGHHRGYVEDSYRRHHYQTRPRVRYQQIVPRGYLSPPVYSAHRNSHAPNVGSAIGGAVGGLLGSQIGTGPGRLAATAAGAVAGYAIGGQIGNRHR